MTSPALWVVVGGNGAGKSTFHRLMLAPLGLPFVNADDIARECFAEDAEMRAYDAARLAADLRADFLVRRESFCYEMG